MVLAEGWAQTYDAANMPGRSVIAIRFRAIRNCMVSFLKVDLSLPAVIAGCKMYFLRILGGACQATEVISPAAILTLKFMWNDAQPFFPFR